MTNATRCSQCGEGRMATTHSRARGNRIDRHRKCSRCGYRDRVIVQPETIVKFLEVSVRNHTTDPATSGAEVLEILSRAETFPQKDRGQ